MEETAVTKTPMRELPVLLLTIPAVFAEVYVRIIECDMRLQKRPLRRKELRMYELGLKIDAKTRRAAAVGLAQLSRRERDVLRLIVKGMTSKEVGAALDISRRTVESHRASILSKLGARNAIHLGGIVAVLESQDAADDDEESEPVYLDELDAMAVA